VYKNSRAKQNQSLISSVAHHSRGLLLRLIHSREVLHADLYTLRFMSAIGSNVIDYFSCFAQHFYVGGPETGKAAMRRSVVVTSLTMCSD